MIDKNIILFEGTDYEINVTAILNSIIAFVMDILGKEVPEIDKVLGE